MNGFCSFILEFKLHLSLGPLMLCIWMKNPRVIFHFHLEYTLYVNQFLKVFEL